MSIYQKSILAKWSHHEKIYDRPPKEFGAKIEILWLLKKLPYGITEAGRQWAVVFENWLMNLAQLCRASEVGPKFV